MPIQQDQLSPLRTTVTYEDINSEPSSRILHNGSDFLKCIAGNYKPTSPIMRYYNTNGDRAAAYTMDSSYVLDISYDNTSNKYYQIRHKHVGGSNYRLALDEIDDEGRINSTIVENLDILPSGGSGITFSGIAQSGIVSLCVDDYNGAFVKVYEDVFRVALNGSYTTSGVYNESSPYIALSSGIMPISGVYSFQYNETAGRFLEYVVYDSNTQEVKIQTLDITGSGAPTTSDRKVFLDIPDWEEHETTVATGYNSIVPYYPCLHGSDHDTLFYFRKNGSSNRNYLKTEGSDGTVAASTTFISATADFVANDVRQGDVIRLTYDESSTPVIKVVEITSVVDSDTVVISESINPDGTVGYKVYSNADLLQFNIDSSLSAFASVNVDDYSLRAGTSDVANVTAEVINAWGDPLNGKTVNFVITEGDGVVNPAQDTTNASGVANTVYNAGTTPGSVRIRATITD